MPSAVMARVQEFAEGSADGTGEAADRVADGLSALGLYITALQQGAVRVSKGRVVVGDSLVGVIEQNPALKHAFAVQFAEEFD